MEYEVKKGDGWYRIAKNLGVNVNDLLQANNAKLDTMLQPGQKLKTSKVPEQPSTTNQWQVVTGQNNAVANWAKQRVDTTMNNINQALAEQEANENEIQRKASIGTKGVVQQQAKADTIRLQQALLKEGYDLGRWGADGNRGQATEKAIAQAEKDGWVVDGHRLVKKPQTVKTNSTPRIFGAGPEYAVMAQAQMYKENPESLPDVDKLVRDITPRQYTAAQNTVSDLIKAPIKRGIGSLLGSDVANFIMPAEEYNENHISPELYNWLQDAIEQKWPLAERQKYFETNPDAKVEKGWKGRIKGTKTKQSDYQKYYGTSYTGPMKYGFKETMFGDGLPQAQGTLGSFNIVYTKDGAYIQDDWDFGAGTKFDTSTLMGAIRSAAERFGSQENDELTPTRKINAFIKYRN